MPLREAAVRWHTGEHQRAIAVLQAARTRVPEAGSLAAQQIEYLANSGDSPAARNVLSQLDQIEAARDRYLAYMALARAYLDADQRDEAAALLSKVTRPSGIITESPSDRLAFVASGFVDPSQVDLAILQRRAGDLEAAHRQFSSIASHIHTDPRALHEWAQTKIALARKIATADEVALTAKQQLLREALDMLVRVTELTHDQPMRASWAWFDIAKVRASLHDPEASIEDALVRALRLNPGEAQFQEWRQRRAARPR